MAVVSTPHVNVFLVTLVKRVSYETVRMIVPIMAFATLRLGSASATTSTNLVKTRIALNFHAIP